MRHAQSGRLQRSWRFSLAAPATSSRKLPPCMSPCTCLETRMCVDTGRKKLRSEVFIMSVTMKALSQCFCHDTMIKCSENKSLTQGFLGAEELPALLDINSAPSGSTTPTHYSVRSSGADVEMGLVYYASNTYFS